MWSFGGQNLQLYWACVLMCTSLNVPYNVRMAFDIMVRLEVSAPLIQCDRCLYDHYNFSAGLFLSSTLTFVVFQCCEHIQWSRSEKKPKREREQSITSNLDLFGSCMHTTFWPVYIALWCYDRNFFVFLVWSVIFSSLLYYLRDIKQQQKLFSLSLFSEAKAMWHDRHHTITRKTR